MLSSIIIIVSFTIIFIAMVIINNTIINNTNIIIDIIIDVVCKKLKDVERKYQYIQAKSYKNDAILIFI